LKYPVLDHPSQPGTGRREVRPREPVCTPLPQWTNGCSGGYIVDGTKTYKKTKQTFDKQETFDNASTI